MEKKAKLQPWIMELKRESDVFGVSQGKCPNVYHFWRTQKKESIWETVSRRQEKKSCPV